MKDHLKLFLVLGCLLGPGLAASVSEEPLLVLLTETGEEEGGLPVLAVHPGAGETAAGLNRGVAGTLLRVYRRVQVYLHEKEGRPTEPAYVLLSGRQGGFAREGFYLGEEDKSSAGYVDVHRDWPVTGEFGSIDQIVPHELAHVLRRQLVGPLAEGGTNQVHALGVRTDRVIAFNEGFAEHFQVMAIDHPDADPATRALAEDLESYERVKSRLDAYHREMSAALSVAPRMRMGFVLWFSNGEDVLRYFAVKANGFAREPDLPERLLSRRDPYPAYLLENILPGRPDGPVKSVSRMIATEGVVSTLFYRWAMSRELRDTYRDEAFYEQFGTSAGEVEPLENLYLKLFHVFYVAKPQDVLTVIDGYREAFPDEAPYVDAVVAEVLSGRPAVAPPEIWLANPDLETGTTVFDQYRGLPRVHTFDLNAASIVDLVSVPGVDPELARTLMDPTPYTELDDLARVPGVSGELVARFREMSREMDELRAAAVEEDVEETLSISAILLPFAYRGAVVLVLAAAVSALLYRAVRSRGESGCPSWLRTVANGLAAALVGAGASWAVGSLASFAAVGLAFGLPAGLWCLRKTRRAPAAWNVLAAWWAAAVPAVVLTTPWL